MKSHPMRARYGLPMRGYMRVVSHTPTMARSALLLAAAAAAAAAASAAPTAASVPPPKRYLPPGALLMGYVGGACDPPALLRSAATGVNVLLWFSINLGVDNVTGAPQVQGGPDLACVANVSAALKAAGQPTTHMISVGGWDAPHPDTRHPAADVYAAWRAWNADVVARPGLEGGFDGVDWDLEGNDTPSDPGNTLTVACLDLVGLFSQAAQADGFLVSLVPPESYLDPLTAPTFDRSLLHPYNDQPAHASFKYHGRSGYALLLAKYGSTPRPDGSVVPTFDWVAVQLYESWSHAAYNITGRLPVGDRQAPADYLARWLPLLYDGWQLDFASDPASGVPSQAVSLPPSRTVLGLANGWADNAKSLLIMPDDVGAAFARLGAAAPRGVAFWSLTNEGDVPPGQTQPLYFGAGINAFLHTR